MPDIAINYRDITKTQHKQLVELTIPTSKRKIKCYYIRSNKSDNMYYKQYIPSPPLQHVVEHYWHFVVELNQSLEQNFQTPLLQGMTFNLKEMPEDLMFKGKSLKMDKPVYLFGQSLQPRVSISNRNGIDIIGVKFKPLGIHTITGINMEHIADMTINAEEIWGYEIQLLCESMYESLSTVEAIQKLDTYLIDKMNKQKVRNRVSCVEHALQVIHCSNGNIDVKNLQLETYTSRKSLERAFINQIGILPKLYSRISRYNNAKESIEKSNTINWQNIIYKNGYYDQSHFINEFKEFSGKTPSEYIMSLRQAQESEILE